ncbi:MAG: RHS repeat-associated core domain-containing protein [Hoeflea sp. D1-CHI-28]
MARFLHPGMKTLSITCRRIFLYLIFGLFLLGTIESFACGSTGCVGGGGGTGDGPLNADPSVRGDPSEEPGGYEPLGDPVDPGTGNVLIHQVDYDGVGVLPLKFERYYSLQKKTFSISCWPDATHFSSGLRGGQNVNWSHSYHRAVFWRPTWCSESVLVERPDGRQYVFFDFDDDDVWIPQINSVRDKLLYVNDGVATWHYVEAKTGNTERYNSKGRLIDITDQEGNTLTLEYASNDSEPNQAPDDDYYAVTTVRHERSGREIQFEWNAFYSKIEKLIYPSGKEVVYQYENVPGGDRLTKVIYPDEDLIPENNPLIEFGFATESGQTNLITSITDESDVQFVEYELLPAGNGNGSGLPISTTGAGGANQYLLGYSLPPATGLSWTTYVQTGEGGELEYFFEDMDLGAQNPVGKLTSITRDCPTCGGPATASYERDPTNGFPVSYSDYKGNKTYFKYNERGFQTCLVEGISGDPTNTPHAYRKIVTEWHASLSKPELRTWYAPLNPSASTPPQDCDDSGFDWVAIRTVDPTYGVDGLVRSVTVTDVQSSLQRTTTLTYFGDDPGDPSALTGLLKSIDGPRTNNPGETDVVTYEYYENASSGFYAVGDLKKINFPEGLFIEITKYDLNGRPLELTSMEGTPYVFSYYARGWLRTLSEDGQITTYLRDARGLITDVINPMLETTEYGYDDARRVTAVTNDVGHAISSVPSSLGNPVSVSLKENAVVRYSKTLEYDGLSRLRELVNGVNDTRTIEYDDNDNIERIIDPRDSNPSSPTLYVQLQYDALDRVVTARDENGAYTLYGYNIFGDVTSVQTGVTDLIVPNGVETTYDFDGFGDLREILSADTGHSLHSYDASGHILSVTDGRGVKRTYRYDGLGRRTAITYEDEMNNPENVSYTYDETSNIASCGPSARNGTGRLTSFSDEAGTTQYVYDGRGNVICKNTVIDGANYPISYSYDNANRLDRITYPSGLEISYYREASTSISNDLVHTVKYSIGGSELDIVSNVEYVPFGPYRYMEHANGLVTTRTLDGDYQVTHRRVEKVGETALIDSAITFDAAGNRDEIDGPGYLDDYSFWYDGASHLKGSDWAPDELSVWARWSHNYDNNSNRTYYAYDSSGGIERSNYYYQSATNRITSIGPYCIGCDEAQTARSFTIDAAGNITQINKPISSLTLTYGDNGRIKNSQLAGIFGFSHEYRYNGLGQRGVRIANTGPHSDRVYLYDEAGRLLAVREENGWAYEYVYMGAVPIAFIKYSGSSGGGSPALYYLHADQLNVPDLTTDDMGNAVGWRYPSDPFSYKPAGTIDHHLAFPGQFREADGIYYNYYRDYDPDTGRYLQSDPIGLAGGLNTYAYALNNPLSYVDREGATPVHATAAAIGAVIGGVTAGVSTALKGGSAGDIAVAAGAGALSGAFAGVTLGAAGSVVAANAAAGAAGSLASGLISGSDSLGRDTAISAITGASGGIGAIAATLSKGGASMTVQALIGGSIAAETQLLFDVGDLLNAPPASSFCAKHPGAHQCRKKQGCE